MNAVLQAAVVVVLVALMIGRRMRPRPVAGDGRRFRLPLILAALGVYGVVELGRGAHPTTVTGKDVGFLVVAGALCAALGALRGVTVKLASVGGQLTQRYSAVTVALWVALVAVRVAMDVGTSSFGVTKAVVGASTMLMFGLSMLGESLVVAARTTPSSGLTAW